MTLVPKDIYRTIEWHFFNYEDIKRQIKDYEESQLDMAGRQITSEGLGHGVGKHGDPTAIIAANIVDGGPKHIQKYRQWIRVIDHAKKACEGTRKEDLINLYYNKGGAYYSVAADMNVSVPTFYDIKEEVVAMAYTAAIQSGLLRVY